MNVCILKTEVSVNVKADAQADPWLEDFTSQF